MPEHLDLLPQCRQDLIYNWVLFQMYTCKLAAGVILKKAVAYQHRGSFWGTVI